MLLGQYVVEGAYKDTTFTKFKRIKRDADQQAALAN